MKPKRDYDPKSQGSNWADIRTNPSKLKALLDKLKGGNGK